MKSLRICLAVLLLFVTACGADSQAGDSEQGAELSTDEEAIKIYKKRCMACHATDYSGRNGPDLRKIGSQMTENEIYEVIFNGATGMPAFGERLEHGQIEALVQWLSSMQ